MQNDIDKKILNILNQIKQQLTHCQLIISQQSKSIELVTADNQATFQLLDQLESSHQSERQIQEIISQLLLKVNQSSNDFKLIQTSNKQQFFKEQLSRIIILIDQSKIQQSSLELSSNIQIVLEEKSQTLQSQIIQTQQQSPQQQQPAQNYNSLQQTLNALRQPLTSQTIFTKTNESQSYSLQQQQQQQQQQQYQQQRSLTPTLQSKSANTTSRNRSIEKPFPVGANLGTTSQTERPNNQVVSEIPQQNKQYQFQSGKIFSDTSKSPRQQMQNKSQLNNSSLVSRSNLFPKYEKLYAIKAHDKRISSIQVGPLCVFTASYDRLIRTWDRQDGKLISTLEGHTKEILTMKYKYEILASGGVDKVIRIWRHHPRWQVVANLKGHIGNVTCVDFLNPKQLISGSEDQSIKVWDIEKGIEIHQLKYEFGISCLNIINDKLYVGGEGILIVYQCPQLQQIRFIQLHEAPIIFILTSRVYLITICREGIVKLLDLQKYTLAKEIRDDYEISNAIYISNLNILALGLSTQNGEGKLCFWSLDTLRKVKEIYDNGSGVGGIGWEQPILWTGHDNKRLEAIKLQL